MPRKTIRENASRMSAAVASMRPRPDAAENRLLVDMARTGGPELQ